MAVREMPGNNILSAKTTASIALGLDFNPSLRYYNVKVNEDVKEKIKNIVKPQ